MNNLFPVNFLHQISSPMAQFTWPLNADQKRVALVAAIAFACLAIAWFVVRRCFNASPSDSKQDLIPGILKEQIHPAQQTDRAKKDSEEELEIDDGDTLIDKEGIDDHPVQDVNQGDLPAPADPENLAVEIAPEAPKVQEPKKSLNYAELLKTSYGMISCLLEDHFGDENEYLSGKPIPPGQGYAIFKKASQFWEMHHTALIAHNANLTPSWTALLFRPLINNVLQSNNSEDLAAAYCWIANYDYEQGYVGDYNHECHTEITSHQFAIQQRLIDIIGDKKDEWVQLMEWLSGHINNRTYEFDYVGRGNFCLFLCRQYYLNPEVSLSDLTFLCSKNIKRLAYPNGSKSEVYIASLIACKAKEVYSKAAPAEQEAFIKEFKIIQSYCQQIVTFGNAFSIVTTATFPDLIGPYVEKIEKECGYWKEIRRVIKYS